MGMGFFDEDTGEMLEIYLLETNQLLDQSDAMLLSAEQEMVFSKESINGIFRVMHTIKSSSAMMGLTGLSTLRSGCRISPQPIIRFPVRTTNLNQKRWGCNGI